MKDKIKETLKDIEKEENIKIIFAIESGSRAWGWESEDSDYDVRGVFIKEKTLFDNKEQINKVIGELDIELWSVEKFMRLFIKSNPSCWEWLSSDIIYEEGSLRLILKEIFESSFSEYALKKHYVSMCRQNFEKYIRNIGDKANLKKYVYVLRSMACVNYIEDKGVPPPKDYKEILSFMPILCREFMEKIINDKRKSESLTGNRNKDVESYVTSIFDKEFEKDNHSFDIERLEEIYKEVKKWH